ncbi:hypothetical protein ACTJIL_04815 [Luteimonas sp. 22616]|uniref:hypothetical protein n=1 Tax=Luteimonas sp. 22616 TaxID=3453951 RepID=UPI003F84BA1C
MRRVIEAAGDAAQERFEEASCRAAAYLAGDTRDLFDTANEEAVFWRGVMLSCDRALVEEIARG